jgi:hypothetical protein
MVALLVGFAAQAPAALAAKGAVDSFGVEGSSGGQFEHQLQGVDVNQVGTGGAGVGDVYVSDQVNNRVQVFSAGGTFIRTFGLGVGGPGVDICTVASSCVAGGSSPAAGALGQAEGLAIDQATGAVYVADWQNRRIDIFSAVGVFEGAFGWGVKATGSAAELQFCTSATGCQAGESGSGPGQFASAGAAGPGLNSVAVSPLNGHIFAADSRNRRISEFAPVVEAGTVTGVTFVRGYGWGARTGAGEFQICTTTCHAPAPPGSAEGQFSGNSPAGLAVDAAGTVYAVDRTEKTLSEERGSRVQTFDSSGNPLGDFAASSLAPGVDAPRRAIAIDPADGHVFVAASVPFMGQHILEFDAAGGLLETYFQGQIPGEVGGLAIGPGSQPYMAYGRNARVYLLGPTVPPTTEIESIDASGGTSADVDAKINPTGLEGSYRIELSTDEGAHWQVKASGDFPSGESDHSYSATIADLEALTRYRVRVVAEKVFGSGTAEDSASFETPAAPPVLGTLGYSYSGACVRLEGAVNPENQQTDYQFEYVSEAQFAESAFAQAVSVPAAAAGLPAGPASVPVAQEVCGLTPGTTYHFRLSARNPTGSTVGSPLTFTTFRTGSSVLPDERAYEQASPVDKNGANIQAGVNVLQAAADGNAVTFFTNAGLPGGEGGQDFPIFVARRSPDGSGWSTQGLLPPASLGPRAFVSGWTGDLTHSYASAWTPGSPTGFYARDTSTGQVGAIATDPVVTESEIPTFAAATSGGADVLFEDTTQIDPRAIPGRSNVYLWNANSGRTVLASVMNDGTAPPAGAFAGPYDWFGNGTEGGGSSQKYYTNESHALSEGASVVYFTAAGSGQLYLRRDPLQPQSPLDGEGGCRDASKACTVWVSKSQRTVPEPERPAVFVGATPGGSMALLMSKSALTDDANTGGGMGRDLYLFDAAGGDLVDLTPDEAGNGAEVRGILGYSDDLSYIYFVANGVLAPGAAPGSCADATDSQEGSCNLYLWHAGVITYIATLAGASAPADTRNWRPTSTPSKRDAAQRTARVTPDGGTLIFQSARRLTAYESGGKSEVFRYTASEAQLQCVSCSPTNAPASGDAGLSNIIAPFTQPSTQAALLTRNLSASGGRIFFDSPDKLVAADTNGVSDVYEWEAYGEGSCRSELDNGGCLFLISTGTSPKPSYFVDASASGDDVFIETVQPLVTQDRDELVDVYDARVHGGIPAQNQAETPSCAGERDCAGAIPPAPGGRPPGTSGFIGPGNPKRAAQCRKGARPLRRHGKYVKRHGKKVCVKRIHKKKHGHHKRRHIGNRKPGHGRPHRKGGNA